MKKTVFVISFFSIIHLSNAQDLKLKNEFTEQRLSNENKLDSYFSKSTAKYSQKEKDSLRKNLAGFLGSIPAFYIPEETRANSTSNVDELQAGTVSGISPVTGNGIKITVFDAGRILDTHEQFSSNRAINKETTTEAQHLHGTNVNGILIGNGNATGSFTQNNITYSKSNAKGILPAGTTDNYMYSATALGNNFEKLSTLPNLNISNHSYGTNYGWNIINNRYYWYGNYDLNSLDTYGGAYTINDQNFDKIVYSQPQQIIIKSTGNYFGIGPSNNSIKYKFNPATNSWVQFSANDTIPASNCSLGYNCVYYGSLAKNIITVGAVNQLTTTNNKYIQSSDVVKANFSSAGPRKDGAVKPDLVAVGVDMILSNYVSTNPTANDQYSVNFGTSYAAPIVSGIAGALTQIQRNISGESSFVFTADEMKALLTHTANEAGNPGPDVLYGWGLVDAKKAAQVLVNKLTEDAYFERINLQSGILFTKEIKATGLEPLKISISWVDPAIAPFATDIELQQNHTSRIVNDLDLRVVEINSGTIYYPWKLNINDPLANATKGDNTVDNVEQIIIENPTANGIYKIEVSSKNTLVDQEGVPTSQNFSLVVTGTKKTTLSSEENLKNKIKVYPTRTSNFVNIESDYSIERIAIFDTNAKLILESKPNKNDYKIDLTKLPNSVYIIYLKTSKKTSSYKIIKD